MSTRKERENKIRYLEGYYWAQKNIESIQERVERKNARLYGAKISHPERERIRAEGVTIEDIIGDRDEIEEEFRECKENQKEKKLEIQRAINRIGDPKAIMLMTLRYIDNFSLAEVAERMGYSYSYITRMHNRILDSLEIGENN